MNKENLQVISKDSTIKYMYLVEDNSDLKQQECPGNTPYNGLHVETSLQRGTFFRVRVYDR